MAEYLVLAENISFKNNKLTCINIYDRLSTIAMPSEFKFDLAILCGPNWTPGEHKLSVKAVGSNGKEVNIGELPVNIPHKDFVYNAFANDIKLIMDYSVETLTFIVYDNGKEIISRTYPVIPMLIPQSPRVNNVTPAPAPAPEKKAVVEKKESEPEPKQEPEPEVSEKAAEPAPTRSASRFGTPKKPKYGEFLNLKTAQELKEALVFIARMPDDNKMKSKLRENVEQQLKALNSKKK